MDKRTNLEFSQWIKAEDIPFMLGIADGDAKQLIEEKAFKGSPMNPDIFDTKSVLNFAVTGKHFNPSIVNARRAKEQKAAEELGKLNTIAMLKDQIRGYEKLIPKKILALDDRSNPHLRHLFVIPGNRSRR